MSTDTPDTPHRTPLSHRHIEVFRAIMQAGSVTQAAAALWSSQPTLSRELARMEQLLGYALFERQAGRLRPTARALALYDEVQLAWQGLARVQERASALRTGLDDTLQLLALPALAHALLPRLCRELLLQSPQARLSITTQEAPLLHEWMGAQRFDLGFAEQAAPQAGVRSTLVARLDEVAVLPAGHPLLSKPKLRLQDFEGERFVSLAPQDPYRQQIDQCFAQAAVQRKLSLQTESAATLCALVAQGLGVAIVNPLTALAAASEALHLRPLAFSLPFELHVLEPLHRPRHALVAPLQTRLQRLMQAVKDDLA
ncbi:LysR family transcriptional regulator [Roseateles sp. BYS180W]|uniref:LysR family transcriptional regulator n=1 Tax=Roseateles rivi TaxID=3299028 RepID=A0ABW7FXK0_9BURK